jgi:outer membrane protein TolC
MNGIKGGSKRIELSKDSERSLYAAQDALVQSDQTVSLNLVQLYKALGGGWQIATNSASAMVGSS